MHTQRQNSNCFCWKELHPPFSFKKCCFFLLIFLLITFIIIGSATFFVILILKPNKPVFSVGGLKINFYKLNDHSNLTLLVSSVLSLTLNAENHNKFGIGYSPSRFLVYHEALPIATIRIPRFFQPPHSDDVTVQSRVLFQCVNVSKIVAKASLQDKAQMNILGDAKAHIWLSHINLLQIKVALDCDMNVNLRKLAFTNEVYSAKVINSQLASLLSNSKAISMKCTSSFSI